MNSLNEKKLIEAVRTGNTRTVRLLLASDTEVDFCTGEGNTALIAAVKTGHSKVVDMLIKAGANVDAQNDLGQTALSVSVALDDVKIMMSLIRAGADAYIPDAHGNTAMCIACGETRDALISSIAKQEHQKINKSEYRHNLEMLARVRRKAGKLPRLNSSPK